MATEPPAYPDWTSWTSDYGFFDSVHRDALGNETQLSYDFGGRKFFLLPSEDTLVQSALLEGALALGRYLDLGASEITHGVAVGDWVVAGPPDMADDSETSRQKLARYWATEYDWRKVEARLNALPNFVTEIDGLDIHFIHVRSKHKNALPLIVTIADPEARRAASSSRP